MRPCTRVSLCVLAVTAAGVLAPTLVPTGPSPAAQKPPENDAVKALLTERLAALDKINDLSMQAYQGGELPMDQMLAAHMALLRGKLDLCETNPDRVKVYEGMVQVAEELLKSVRRRADLKQVSGVDVLKAEVQVLEAKIGLEKAKAAK